MHCFSVAVLRVLNQKYHQERDDGCGGVDDQLPGVREMKRRSGDEPNKNYKHGAAKCPSAAKQDGCTLREDAERVADDTKDIVSMFVLFQLFCLGLVHDATYLFARDSEFACTDIVPSPTREGIKRIDFPPILGKTWPRIH